MPSFWVTGMTALWECWYNLVNLTNQRVYQELVYRNKLFKEMITSSATPSLPRFLTFYFCVRAFSIQRARLSWSLEQAISHQTDNLTLILTSAHMYWVYGWLFRRTLNHNQIFLLPWVSNLSYPWCSTKNLIPKNSKTLKYRKIPKISPSMYKPLQI